MGLGHAVLRGQQVVVTIGAGRLRAAADSGPPGEDVVLRHNAQVRRDAEVTRVPVAGVAEDERDRAGAVGIGGGLDRLPADAALIPHVHQQVLEDVGRA